MSIFCARGPPHSVEPTSPKSIEVFDLKATTSESKKGSPKVDFSSRAVVFKSPKRQFWRFRRVLTPPPLRRGRTRFWCRANLNRPCSNSLGSGTTEFGQFSEQLLRSNEKWFRGGIVFKAHKLLYHSTLGRESYRREEEEDLHLQLGLHVTCAPRCTKVN